MHALSFSLQRLPPGADQMRKSHGNAQSRPVKKASLRRSFDSENGKRDETASDQCASPDSSKDYRKEGMHGRRKAK